MDMRTETTETKDPFFKLNGNHKEIGNEDEFIENLNHHGSFENFLYRPDTLNDERGHHLNIEGKNFKNFSFSKTKISNIIFKNCNFENCLFIGTKFSKCSFHDCSFIDCNFYKSEITKTYGNPSQFEKAIRQIKYSNIAVHLFQQLRNNYHDEMQPEFQREAEYYFRKWHRNLKFEGREYSGSNGATKIDKKHKSKIKSATSMMMRISTYATSLAYDFFLGYGYKAGRTFASSVALISIMTTIAHLNHNQLFSEPTSASIIDSLYFTVCTMATLGASGYSPTEGIGQYFLILTVAIGVLIFTVNINLLARRISR